MKEPGVMMFQGRIICYDCSGDWIKAIELGAPDPLPMPPELNRAIHEDLARGRRKAAEFRMECGLDREAFKDEASSASSLPARPRRIGLASASEASQPLMRRRA